MPLRELQLAAGSVVPAVLLGFGEDPSGELYALFGNGDVAKLVPPSGAPEIFAPPTSQNATAGNAVTFTAAANGAGPFTYQWQRDNMPIPGATSANFSLPSVQRFHAGAYRVVVTNASGSATSSAAALTVNAATASNSRLVNLSTRGFVGVGDAIMIPGVVISAEGPKTLLVRAVGPTLALDPYNVTGVLADPQLTIYSGPTPILTNDNWGDSPDAAYTAQISAQVFAFALPAASKDASFVVTLPPGAYTIHAAAADGVSPGVAIVEVYVVE